MALTHVRELKRYASRFEFRVSRLSIADRAKLNALLDLVHVDSQECGASHNPRPCDQAGKLEKVLGVFSPTRPERPPLPAAKTIETQDILSRAPLMLLNPAHGSPKRLKQDAQPLRPSGRILNGLTSSPPPGGRGAIRAQCAEAAAPPLDTHGACGATDPRPYI